MNFKIGNFLEQEANVYIFLANGQLNSKGELIMGAGAARAVKEKYPAVPYYLGERIKDVGDKATRDDGQTAYVYYVCSYLCFLALQTKFHWREYSPLSLIDDSLLVLRNTLIEKPTHWTFSMAYPGIGKGGLKKEEVEPLLHQYLDILGDRLTVWSLE